jgi:DNA-binding MurR/RpiR family transcriptional regulator
MDAMNWAGRLAGHSVKLSRREAGLVEWIVSAPHEAAFLKLQELAEKASVSKPTVISCYRQLGYQDYQEFQKGMQEFYAGQIDSYRAGAVALRKMGSLRELVDTSLDVEAQSVEAIRANLDPVLLETIAREILGARSVYVYGDGTGFYPGHYLVQRLRQCGIHAFLAGTDREHVLDEMMPIGENDVFLSFYYTQDAATLRSVLDVCSSHGAHGFLVMGFLDPELCSRAYRHIFIPRGNISFKNSMAAPMSFAQLLLMAVEFLGGDRIANALKNLEMTRKGIINRSKEEL